MKIGIQNPEFGQRGGRTEADEVEVGQVASSQKVGKAVVVEANVRRAPCLSEAPRADDVAGVEVGGVKLDVRVGCRQEFG